MVITSISARDDMIANVIEPHVLQKYTYGPVMNVMLVCEWRNYNADDLSSDTCAKGDELEQSTGNGNC